MPAWSTSWTPSSSPPAPNDDGYLTAAERAAADRDWTFGHVIVDEAQELSAMAWRMVMRRCPMRSMTLVGDLAQTGSDPAGAPSWARMLGPYVGGRLRVEELTVNYRTPAEIMVVAADVLALIGPGLTAPTSVRETGARPWAVSPLESLGDVVKAEIVEGGRLVVIVPESAWRSSARSWSGPSTARSPGPGPRPWTRRWRC